jgi:hypothetical protein
MDDTPGVVVGITPDHLRDAAKVLARAFPHLSLAIPWYNGLERGVPLRTPLTPHRPPPGRVDGLQAAACCQSTLKGSLY